MQRTLALALLLITVAAFARPPAPTVEHVGEAVERIYALDRERVRAQAPFLGRQDITRHRIDAAVDPSRGTLEAVDRVTLTLTGPDAVFTIDPAFEIAGVTDGEGRPLRHAVAGGRLTVAVPGTEERSATVVVSYAGRDLAGDGTAASPTFLLLAPERAWYPNGIGHDPALVRLTVRYPSGLASVCTGTLSGMVPPSETTGSHPVGDVWDIAVPVRGAALLVTTAESEWGFRGSTSISVHRRRLARGADGVTIRGVRELLRFLESCYGPYPYEWLHVVVTESGAGLDAPIHGPGMVVLPADVPSSEGFLEYLAAPLSASWWDWSADAGPLVSGGLSGYAELSWLEAAGKEEEVRRRREFRRYQYVRALTQSGGVLPLSECLGPAPADDPRVCVAKGSAFFEMLEHVAGREALCAALSALSEQWDGGPLPFGQVVGAVEERAGTTLDWFVYDWVVRGGLPTYSLEYEVAPADGQYRVRGVIRQEGEAYRTPLPLTVDLGGWAYEEWIDIESADQSFELTTETEPLELVIDASRIIPKLDPEERAHAHFERGIAAAGENQWGRAVDELGAAARLAPDQTAYWFEYGEALIRSGRVEQGIEAVERAVDASPDATYYRAFLTRMYLSTERYDEALEHVSRLLEDRPGDFGYLSNRAVALTGLGRLDEAADVLAEARSSLDETEVAPAATERFYVAVGLYHEAAGDVEEASAAFRYALRVNPLSDEARRGLERLRARGER